VLGAVLFVLGFTAVFVSYGAAFGGVGRHLTLHQRGLDQVLGVVTILMGLAFAGAFSRFSFANREIRWHRLPHPGLAGAPLLGVLFAIGWTPCIGPTLAAVQGLAFDSATAGRGALLSAAYSLGLGVPFVLVAVAFRRAAWALAGVRRHARTLMMVGGVLLIVVGVLEVTGVWNDAVVRLRDLAPGYTPAI
jgi:cytochrome c-type biogenesis protein